MGQIHQLNACKGDIYFVDQEIGHAVFELAQHIVISRASSKLASSWVCECLHTEPSHYEKVALSASFVTNNCLAVKIQMAAELYLGLE